MESNSQDDDKVTINKEKPFDAGEAAILLELSPRQKAFADAILMGCTQTRAAEIAGYSGQGATLRSTASNTAKSPKVMSYIAWAKNGQAGLPDDPATLAEIERTLSKHLRGSDKPASLRASELLTKLHIARDEARAIAPADPIEALDRMAATGEFGLLTALLLSKEYKLTWEPKQPVAPDAEQRQIASIRETLSPADLRRADYIVSLQNPNSPASGFSHAPEIASGADGAVGGPTTRTPSFLDGNNPIHELGALTRDQAENLRRTR